TAVRVVPLVTFGVFSDAFRIAHGITITPIVPGGRVLVSVEVELLHVGQGKSAGSVQ
ncbi:hypothetical protein LCGC14_2721450, partial [marine sediment metagenome]